MRVEIAGAVACPNWVIGGVLLTTVPFVHAASDAWTMAAALDTPAYGGTCDLMKTATETCHRACFQDIQPKVDLY